MSIYAIKSNKYEITLGYDEMMGSLWLIVHFEYEKEEERYDEDGEERYLFHHMRDWPGGKMDINDIRMVLKQFNEGVCAKLLSKLFQEIRAGGFFKEYHPYDFLAKTELEIQAEFC